MYRVNGNIYQARMPGNTFAQRKECSFPLGKEWTTPSSLASTKRIYPASHHIIPNASARDRLGRCKVIHENLAFAGPDDTIPRTPTSGNCSDCRTTTGGAAARTELSCSEPQRRRQRPSPWCSEFKGIDGLQCAYPAERFWSVSS